MNRETSRHRPRRGMVFSIVMAALVAIAFTGCPSVTPPAPTYTVTYAGNGNSAGDVPADTNAYKSGDSVTVLGQGSLERSGFTFVGWTLAQDGSGTVYAAGSTFAMGSANATMYAKWTALPTYTLTYDGNENTGGTAPVDTNQYLQDATVTVAQAGSLTRTGYIFSRWNTAANGTGTNYAAGSTFAMGSANVLLYAIWTPLPKYTVTYLSPNSVSGTVPSGVVEYYQGDTVTVLGNTGDLARPPHSFLGWTLTQDRRGPIYNAGDTFVMGTANVRLYAKFTYVMTYNGNGNTSGSAPVDNTEYGYDDTVIVRGNTQFLSKPGYAWAGWNTEADGTGTYYTEDDTFLMKSDTTLYTVWEESTIIIANTRPDRR